MALHIPDSLSRFRDESALIIVAGEKAAKIYAVSGGMIEEATDIPQTEVHYSDKEEHWASGGRGQFLGSGATGDGLDEQEKASFKRNITEALEHVWKPSYTDVYLLSSEWGRGAVLESLPSQAKKVTIVKRTGNFVRNSPLEILTIIAEE